MPRVSYYDADKGWYDNTDGYYVDELQPQREHPCPKGDECALNNGAPRMDRPLDSARAVRDDSGS